MERQTKIFLIVTGGIVLLGVISFGIYKLVTKDDTGGDDEGDKNDSRENPSQVNNYYSYNSTTNPGPTANPPPTDPGMVNPRYNQEGELINPMAELKGRYLYPKRKEVGGAGYANIRTSPAVNTDDRWWDFSTNLLTTINSGTPIGKVSEEAAGEINGYSHRWFKVQLYKPVWVWWAGTLEYGFVRADTVTIKPYEK